uniref:Uncharacterized protein n=1 Tax=Fusarium oxysporum (strain Fo5176) TaxID=660025 RepID=A0A0D2XRI3_FUSOF
MTSQRPDISVSFTATSSQTSLAPDSSVISNNGDSDVGETSISPLLASQFKKKKQRAAKTRNHLEEAFSRMSQNTNPLKRRRHDDETTDLDADKFEQLTT